MCEADVYTSELQRPGGVVFAKKHFDKTDFLQGFLAAHPLSLPFCMRVHMFTQIRYAEKKRKGSKEGRKEGIECIQSKSWLIFSFVIDSCCVMMVAWL